MTFVTTIGGVSGTKILKTKHGREFLEIRLASHGFSKRRIFWKCHSYQPQHLDLITWLPVGRQIMLQGQLSRLETYMSKERKPEGVNVLRISEIVFLPKDVPLDQPPSFADDYDALNTWGESDVIDDQQFSDHIPDHNL